jgi:hypothetical protein
MNYGSEESRDVTVIPMEEETEERGDGKRRKETIIIIQRK